MYLQTVILLALIISLVGVVGVAGANATVKTKDIHHTFDFFITHNGSVCLSVDGAPFTCTTHK